MIKKFLLTPLIIVTAFSAIALSEDIVLHEENFENITVRVGPTGSEWNPGQTIPGFYAVIGALEPDGAPKYIAQNPNGERANSTQLYLFEKEDHRSLGFAVGSSTGDAILALRLENQSDQNIKEISLSFDIHQWSSSSKQPKVVKLSFTEGDPLTLAPADVYHFLSSKEDSIKWTDIPKGEVVVQFQGEEASVNPLVDGVSKVSVRQAFLDWPPNTALWIRWNFSGSPWGKLSLDNVRVTTSGAQ